ncbi:MAG TPA: tripartite tricarboxylate transporter TctB family protein [Burkholderiaceae bacterium]|nr:tripartite tricarboxylate transporter TctB family protein [Burkholderiaceae bacterium]
MKIRDQKNFWSGLMFIAFGLFFVVWSQQYDMGTAARMGPAFFPTVLGGLTFLLGVVVTIEGLAAEHADGKIEPFNFRALVLVLGSVVAFGLLLRPAGLLVALFVLVGMSSLGSHEFKLRDVLLLSIGMSLLVLTVFIYGLSMTIPVLPSFMRD